MLYRKFKNILFIKTVNSHVIYRPLVPTRSFSKWFNVLSGPTVTSGLRMKTIRDIIIIRFLNGWSRSNLLSCMVKKYRTDKGVRDVVQYFREVFFRPRKMHFIVTASAVYKKTEEKSGPPKKCSRNIKDKDMKKLISDLEGIEELSRTTLYCEACSHRIVIDNKHSGIRYCSCQTTKPVASSFEGWEPYMEAEDIIIWRKEYKTGGLYAYKVYGRYKHIRAEDFAMIQVDGHYRPVWDNAVASLEVVEKEANGVQDQAVLHWEVLWPRLFANRDYVFLRRHTKFNVQSRRWEHKDGIFVGELQSHTPHENPTRGKPTEPERINVHTAAKNKSIESEKNMKIDNDIKDMKDNTVFVIISRSCVHPKVPESNKTIRVMEYWSHMVVTTLNGPDEPGMEFVLTYYDEPAVGGLPTAITAWAMGRAGPAFLDRMRAAAGEYKDWRGKHPHFEPVEFHFTKDKKVEKIDQIDKVSMDRHQIPVNELDLETSKEGPDILLDPTGLDHKDIDPETGLDLSRREQSTQTRPVVVTPIDTDPTSGPCVEVTIETKKEEVTPNIEKQLEKVSNTIESDKENNTTVLRTSMLDKDNTIADKIDEKETEEETRSKWWRYLYPFYYFV